MKWSNRFKQEEYTGEDRCLPCTIVNLSILLILSLIIGCIISIRRSYLESGIIVMVILIFGIFVIWSRGYLVPKTPELTKKYMPTWMLKIFGKKIYENIGYRFKNTQAILKQLDIIEPCKTDNDICLTESFKSEWRKEVNADNNSYNVIHNLYKNSISIKAAENNDSIYLENDKRIILIWPSVTALQIDAATVQVLKEKNQWEDWPLQTKANVISSIRMLLDYCPDGSDLVRDSEIVESCCSNHEVVTGVCAKSGDKIFELPLNQ
jgi:hypothetical protein